MRCKAAGKPVVASMSWVAASGGYYIAMDADDILAAPTTITGSIGVFAVFPTVQHTLGKFGVTNDGVGTTRLAGRADLDRDLGPEAKEILQSSVEHTTANSSSTWPRRARIAPRKSTRGAGPRVDRRGRAGHRHGGQSRRVKDAIEAAARLASLGKASTKCAGSSRRTAGAKRSCACSEAPPGCSTPSLPRRRRSAGRVRARAARALVRLPGGAAGLPLRNVGWNRRELRGRSTVRPPPRGIKVASPLKVDSP